MTRMVYNNVNDAFTVPIRYNEKVKMLNENVVSELELVKQIDATSNDKPIYYEIFKPFNKASSEVITQIADYYTTDVSYLKQTQKLIKTLNSSELNTIRNKHGFTDFDFEMSDMMSLWNEIKGETGFCEKYLYIDWEFAKSLNYNSSFLQLMSLYNIVSPILSLCLPIFVLIIPFIIIKMQNIELNITQYVEIIKTIIPNHAIFKIFTQFHEVDKGQKMYLILSSAFYLFSIYQNILVCIRFYSNMQKIHKYLNRFKIYIAYTVELMEYYCYKANKLTKYQKFISVINDYKNIMCNLHNKLSKISPFTFAFSKFYELGQVMCCFYELYDNPVYNNAILYSFGFNGYFNMFSNVGELCGTKIAETTFSKKCRPTFKKMYYPKFINSDSSTVITNDFKLNKNMIITGPNASGKTTTLKSAIINIILSQQIGFGCFESLQICPYDNFHCYLNIPDTSGRDSLFQAEARRCKEIIDCIDHHNIETHFCIFDELYSGTNPEEAVDSANAFMNYIVKNENVTCILTTHYIKLCKKLSKNKMIKNYNMLTLKKNDNFEYTYKIHEGISKIKGGIKVLHDMNYPKEILDLANTK